MEEGEDIKKVKMKVTRNDGFQIKKTIPGLDLHAREKSTDDKNLAPFSLTNPKTLQYGNTSFISHSTDHPDWAAGECFNLQKYTGIYRVKVSGITQQVN